MQPPSKNNPQPVVSNNNPLITSNEIVSLKDQLSVQDQTVSMKIETLLADFQVFRKKTLPDNIPHYDLLFEKEELPETFAFDFENKKIYTILPKNHPYLKKFIDRIERVESKFRKKKQV